MGIASRYLANTNCEGELRYTCYRGRRVFARVFLGKIMQRHHHIAGEETSEPGDVRLFQQTKKGPSSKDNFQLSSNGFVWYSNLTL